MIYWDKYKKELIELREKGNSYAEITRIMASRHDEIKSHLASSVTKALKRWEAESEQVNFDSKKRILIFDIETSPMLVWNWSLRQKYTSPEAIEKQSYVICWSAKWLFEDEVIEGSVTPSESIERDDERIIKKLWYLLNEADIVITYNGDKFDIPKINQKFLKFGLDLPSPYKSLDIYKTVRRRFSLPSNKLDYVAKYLDLDQKHDTNFQLWLDCMKGDEKQLQRMQDYCSQDILVTENVYLRILPFIKNHPNVNIYTDSNYTKCPSCGSENLKEDGYYVTYVNRYKAVKCNDCGSQSRLRTTDIPVDQRKSLIKGI